MAEKKKPDLNKLKAEIASRKNEKNSGLINEVGGNVKNINTAGINPRDAFLHGLMESIKTGKKTGAIEKIATINNTAIQKLKAKGAAHPKDGDLVMSGVQNTKSFQQPQQQNIPPQQQKNTINPNADRDNLMDEHFNNQQQTLIQSIENFKKTPYVGTPMNNQQVIHGQQQQGQSYNLNEAYLAESVQNIVDGYLVKNFTPVIEEAIQNALYEVFATEKIKSVIDDNPDIIKNAVREVIKEIQQKSKKRKQQAEV